jgi:hypothetical protein
MTRALLLALGLCLAAAAAAQPASPQPSPQPGPQAAPQSPAKPAAKAKSAKAPRGKPTWAELSAGQQAILSPLKTDWEALDNDRRRKWIGIAKRYPNMKPTEQERVQKRMEAWVKLTVEQRRQARESYKRIAKVPPEKRAKLRQQWAEYQALSPQERESADPNAGKRHQN